MAMLAERKQKQKWTLNPRGKYWSEDANKFGQRMLEKMGWSSGKGLGAKEDGITEHIKQSYKNDSKGVGFEDKGDQWTKHEVDFSSLLQNLSDSSQADIKKPEVSLEKKSQSSRARVHYHKFTRGKDLSRYSEKDLANVFGRKTLEKKVPEVTEVVVESNENKDFGVMTVHGGNMAEYFKSKLKDVVTGPTEKSESDDERPSFGFGYAPAEYNEIKSGIEEDLEEIKPVDEVTNPEIKTDKKKKKKTKVVITECFDNPGFCDFTDNPVEETTEETPSKKKKRKSDKEQMAFDNPGLNINLEEEANEAAKARKSKKRKLEVIQEEAVEEPEVEETTPKKKKKMLKEETEIRSEGTENCQPKKSKKKKNKAPDNNITETPEPTVNEEVKSTKKSKKGKQENGFDNLACTANSVQQDIEETIASMSDAIDDYQLELENQMNEKKAKTQMQNARYDARIAEKTSHARKSVKNLLQGKIKYNFEGSNLPQIAGYGLNR